MLAQPRRMWRRPVVGGQEAPMIYVVLTLLRRVPHRLNYPVPITPQNAATQYRLMRTFLAGAKAVLVGALAYILWRSAEVALGRASGLGRWALAVLIAPLVVLIAAYLVSAATHRRPGSAV